MGDFEHPIYCTFSEDNVNAACLCKTCSYDSRFWFWFVVKAWLCSCSSARVFSKYGSG